MITKIWASARNALNLCWFKYLACLVHCEKKYFTFFVFFPPIIFFSKIRDLKKHLSRHRAKRIKIPISFGIQHPCTLLSSAFLRIRRFGFFPWMHKHYPIFLITKIWASDRNALNLYCFKYLAWGVHCEKKYFTFFVIFASIIFFSKIRDLKKHLSRHRAKRIKSIITFGIQHPCTPLSSAFPQIRGFGFFPWMHKHYSIVYIIL